MEEAGLITTPMTGKSYVGPTIHQPSFSFLRKETPSSGREVCQLTLDTSLTRVVAVKVKCSCNLVLLNSTWLSSLNFKWDALKLCMI